MSQLNRIFSNFGLVNYFFKPCKTLILQGFSPLAFVFVFIFPVMPNCLNGAAKAAPGGAENVDI